MSTAVLKNLEVTNPFYREAESGTLRQADEADLPRYRRRLPPEDSPAMPVYRDDIRQRFEGVVTKIDEVEKTWSARIEDLTHKENPEEEITFSLEEVDDHDLPLLRVGATFRWKIGYIFGDKIPKTSISAISFVRLPEWTDDEFANAQAFAEEHSDFFQSNR